MATADGSTIQNLKRVFIGRESELAQLRSAFDETVGGHGRLAVVVGEPGIGKTALTEQLAAHVAQNGGTTLVGHCYEEGSLSLAYLPFVEAMRTHVLSAGEESLREQLGTAAGYVARLLPETRGRLNVEPVASTDPDEDRFRLMQSIGDFLGRTGEAQPVLIVLEDLHDADPATIDLLKYLSRRLDGMRVLVVGTYRDIEVDRTHPLSAAIADLRRAPSFLRVPLRGLTVEEVGHMISSMSGQEVRVSLAEAVQRQTEGNPLFVQEVLRYFVEQGLVIREGDRWVGTWRFGSGELPESAIPEGLCDVIGQRLTRLTLECNRVLAVAAVIGRDFTLGVLTEVTDVGEDALITALDEARAAGIVEERAAAGGNVSYRFAHAFFRQTLYDEMGAARRIRIHQQVGRAIEQVYARRLEEHAAELADHFAHSSSEEDLAKAVAYGEQAAKQAMAVYGFAEAVRLMERALDVQDLFDSDDKARRCDLLLLLSEAIVSATDPTTAGTDVPEHAFELAEDIGDPDRASAAVQYGLTALTSGKHAEMRRWVERANRYDKTDAAKARTKSMLAMALRAEGRRRESRLARIEAVRLARTSGDADILAATGNTFLMLPTAPGLEPASA